MRVPEEGLTTRVVLLDDAHGQIRMCCQGHNKDMQRLLREQDVHVHAVKINLVVECCNILMVLCKSHDMEHHVTIPDVGVVMDLIDTLIELVQGPCTENQEIVADLCASVITYGEANMQCIVRRT